ncbi:MAG TPA: hypothetical protein DCS88_08265 [Alphaproteobacteria bacterium]|nr:hypothetical protein [Alphaproteobacteria bacterium]
MEHHPGRSSCPVEPSVPTEETIFMSRKQKLELTWIGKDARPRILIVPPLSPPHHGKRRGRSCPLWAGLRLTCHR